MRHCSHRMTAIACLMTACLCIFSCKTAKEEKKGSLSITDTEYSIRQTHENSYVLDACGKVKNVGDVDVKKVVITAYCKSCGEAMISENWFISDCEKTEEQKDTVSYLAIGGEEEFSFKEVAFYFGPADFQPDKFPEKIEVVIESYDAVEDI